tara:strand:+ start:15191 stop:15610 length:420 start_codon:yes stop_codon:yes gene_type:complete
MPAITPDFKSYEVFRNHKIHLLAVDDRFGATERFTAATSTGYDGTPTVVLENPISYIKAVANQYDQDSTSDAYYAGRLVVKVGVLTSSGIAGTGWATSGNTKILTLYLDEGDIVAGPFEYVECETSSQDEAVLCFEIIQ